MCVLGERVLAIEALENRWKALIEAESGTGPNLYPHSTTFVSDVTSRFAKYMQL